MQNSVCRFFAAKVPLAVAAMLVVVSARSISAQARYDAEPIRYAASVPNDPVAQLQKRLEKGEISLTRDARHDYLESVLQHLNIPASSQGLVLSKTSFQSNLINPHRPRAVYFNDDTYVGYVQGGSVLELISIDPQLGSVFYLLKQHTNKPTFVRQNFECMQCHLSDNTQNVPGLLMRSVYADLEGQPIQTAGSFVTTDHSPLGERWGGWYVTGKYGRQQHMGNMTCDDEGHHDQAEFYARANIANVSKLIKTEAYPRDTSDIVALMVLGHQQQLHNLLTSTSYYVRTALYQSQENNKAIGRPNGPLPEDVQQRIAGACEKLVRAMLFSGEAPLAETVGGLSGFAEEFATRGMKDSRGRSLRDFDLNSRLFKYPCSYLIYSEQFEGLPAVAKDIIYRRMWEVLTGKDEGKAFAHLSKDDRNSILQILRGTKKGLPGYWKG